MLPKTRCAQARQRVQGVGFLGCVPARPGALFASLLAAVACGPPSTPVEDATNANAGAAIVTAVAAGTLWLAAGGCRLQGCPYGSYCNKQTGYCDVVKCEHGCPQGTICNEGLGLCQAPPPPKVPNDFLPQDDARNPPGTN